MLIITYTRLENTQFIKIKSSCKNQLHTIIYFSKFLISFLVSLVLIRMILQCQFPIRAFDLLLGSTFRNLKNVVITLTGKSIKITTHQNYRIRNTLMRRKEQNTYDAMAISEYDKHNNSTSNFDPRCAISVWHTDQIPKLWVSSQQNLGSELDLRKI